MNEGTIYSLSNLAGLGKTHRLCSEKRPWDVWGGVGVLLLDVSVKLEIIDFLQPRIKRKLREYIIIIPEKCVIGIEYVQSLSPFARIIFRACLGPGLFALDMAIDTTIRGSFWNLMFLEEGVGV